MRRVGDGLDRAADALALQLIEHQREDDRQRKAQHQAQQAQRERVAHGDREPVGIEEAIEVVQPAPGAAHDAQLHFVRLKRDQNAVHGLVGEEYDVDQRGQQHDVHLPAAQDAQKRFARLAPAAGRGESLNGIGHGVRPPLSA